MENHGKLEAVVDLYFLRDYVLFTFLIAYLFSNDEIANYYYYTYLRT